MVVPSPTGHDLLKEHAWYEYGHKEFQSVMDFDYVYAKSDCISHYSFHYHLPRIHLDQLLLATLISIVAYFLLKVAANALKTTRSIPSELKLELPFSLLSRKHDHEEVYDLESAPDLCYSNSTTPTSSPHLSRDQLNVNTYTFSDVNSSQSKVGYHY